VQLSGVGLASVQTMTYPLGRWPRYRVTRADQRHASPPATTTPPPAPGRPRWSCSPCPRSSSGGHRRGPRLAHRRRRPAGRADPTERRLHPFERPRPGESGGECGAACCAGRPDQMSSGLTLGRCARPPARSAFASALSFKINMYSLDATSEMPLAGPGRDAPAFVSRPPIAKTPPPHPGGEWAPGARSRLFALSDPATCCSASAADVATGSATQRARGPVRLVDRMTLRAHRGGQCRRRRLVT
jgi:hypothetical protein